MFRKIIGHPVIRQAGAKVEKFIGTDLRYLTKNGAILFVGQILISIATFGFTWVLANYVSKELVGEYRFILSIQVVLSIIALSGLSTALAKSVAEGYESSLQSAFRIKIKYGLYSSIASVLVGLFYLYTEANAGLFWGFVALAISIPLYESSMMVFSYFQGKKDFSKQSFYTSLTRLIVIILSAAACIMGTNLVILVLLNFLIGGLLQYIVYKQAIRRMKVEHGVEVLEKKDNTFISLGMHFTVMGILLAVVGQLDRFILFQFFGAASLAGYWIATSMPLELQRIVTVVGSVSFPKFVNKEKEVIKKTLPRKLYIAGLGLAGIAGIYIVLAPYVFKIFFPEYIDGVFMSQMFALGLIFMPHLFIWQYFAAVGNKRVLYWYHIIDPVVQIALYLALIPIYGVWGVVWATVIKNAILAIVGLVFLRKH